MEKEEGDYCISKSFEEMLRNPGFYSILEELIDFGISRYKENYSRRYQNTDLVLYQKYTYEAAKWLTNETLNSVEWLPADQGLVEKIGAYLKY